MPTVHCGWPSCPEQAWLHLTEADGVRLRAEHHLCDAHARQFFATVRASSHCGCGPSGRSRGAVCFGVDLVVIDERSSEQLVCLREVGGRREFAYATGIFEACAINWILTRSPYPRPLTHCAVVEVIRALGGALRSLDVNAMCDNIYEAKLHIEQAAREVDVDVRIGDGVPVAVAAGAPIFIGDDVLAKAPEAPPDGILWKPSWGS